MGLRWYDPREGRFITEDQAQPNLRVPLTENPWLYAADSPATWVDPLGLRVMADGGGGDDGSVDASAVAVAPAPTPTPAAKPKKQSQNPVQGVLNWFGSKADAVKHTVINVVRKTQAAVSAVGTGIDDTWQRAERVGEDVGRFARDTARDFAKSVRENLVANVAGAALGAVDTAKIVMRKVQVVSGTIQRGIIRNGSRAISFVEREVAGSAKRVVAHVTDEVVKSMAMVERETVGVVVASAKRVDFAVITRTTVNLSKIAFRASAVLEVAVDVGGQAIDEFKHQAERTWSQHAARIGLAVLKAGAIIGAGVVAGIVIAAAVGTAPVWIPIAAGIAVGLAIGYAADKAQGALIQADPADIFGKGD
jgi:hypothetical protein